ncbi:hypothetical protein AB1Y20_006786 [Prymnesium parvum]|uniref:Uncharacterized protein n=1 Tax=Prymnesium parvum TaxID=97485 RepID=A0AB34IZV0_PRYPA
MAVNLEARLEGGMEVGWLVAVVWVAESWVMVDLEAWMEAVVVLLVGSEALQAALLGASSEEYRGMAVGRVGVLVDRREGAGLAVEEWGKEGLVAVEAVVAAALEHARGRMGVPRALAATEVEEISVMAAHSVAWQAAADLGEGKRAVEEVVATEVEAAVASGRTTAQKEVPKEVVAREVGTLVELKVDVEAEVGGGGEGALVVEGEGSGSGVDSVAEKEVGSAGVEMDVDVQATED